MIDKLQIDAIYVLSVRSFGDRMAHVRAEMGRHAIDFEFIFAHDIPELRQDELARHFKPGCTIGLPQQSLVLKHVEAWRQCVERGHRRILVFEDDVILHRDFTQKLNIALQSMDTLGEAYLLFLGGADTRVPAGYFLEKGPVFPNAIATADGYVTDLAACTRRLTWIDQHLVDLPADHLLKRMDRECDIKQYWTTTALVEQGSVFGLFSSTLDAGRKRHSNAFNLARYRWKIFQRRTLPGFIVRSLRRFFKP